MRFFIIKAKRFNLGKAIISPLRDGEIKPALRNYRANVYKILR